MVIRPLKNGRGGQRRLNKLSSMPTTATKLMPLLMTNLDPLLIEALISEHPTDTFFRKSHSIDASSFNGWGVTMYDALDTMILMGLDAEFARALPHIQNANFNMSVPGPSTSPRQQPVQILAPFFETVIRYLGGLLSAYALSREPILLERADHLAHLLSPAFDTHSGLPVFGVNTVT